MRVPAIANGPAKLKPAVVHAPLHHGDVMPTVLALAGGQGDPTKPFDGRDATATLSEGRPSPHADILINVEAFRGAIRQGKWKLITIALLPGTTALFDLDKDPGEQANVADNHPEVVQALEAQLLSYAKQQKPSAWMKAQIDFLGFQGETLLDPEYNIDHGSPTEKPVMPEQ